MTTDNKQTPGAEQAPTSLRERINQEARRRAKALAESFDLMECMHLEALGFDLEDEEQELAITLTVQTMGARRHIAETRITFEEINEALQDFIEEHFPAKIAEQLLDQVLSSANPDIDVTGLEAAE